MPVPVHQLVTTEDYLAVLGGQPTKFAAGERFSYCNAGYVVLALIAERVGGEPFPDLVRRRVCEPAGMPDTAFLRSDEPSRGVAVGYVQAEGPQTNVFHLPVRGSGDGGIYSTVADISSLWRALFAGEIVSTASVTEMIRPRSLAASGSLSYGLGFWLHPSSGAVELHGCDAGVSFRTIHDPARNLTHTVISNTHDGAWPVSDYLDEHLEH
jgi:CubicO group peptidase (beta-lactamase class C family)